MQHQSTHALDSTGSSTLHQIPEEQQERTGGQTGLALGAMDRRPPRDKYEDKDGYIDHYSERVLTPNTFNEDFNEGTPADFDNDSPKNIVAGRAVEEH